MVGNFKFKLTCNYNILGKRNEVAGCKKIGHKWRSRYLEITYKTFEYKKYEDLVLLAAKDVGLNTE